jgi:hypothetical protein
MAGLPAVASARASIERPCGLKVTRAVELGEALVGGDELIDALAGEADLQLAQLRVGLEGLFDLGVEVDRGDGEGLGVGLRDDAEDLAVGEVLAHQGAQGDAAVEEDVLGEDDVVLAGDERLVDRVEVELGFAAGADLGLGAAVLLGGGGGAAALVVEVAAGEQQVPVGEDEVADDLLGAELSRRPRRGWWPAWRGRCRRG